MWFINVIPSGSQKRKFTWSKDGPMIPVVETDTVAQFFLLGEHGLVLITRFVLLIIPVSILFPENPIQLESVEI